MRRRDAHQRSALCRQLRVLLDESMPHMAGHAKPGYLVDLSPALQKLNQAGSLGSGQLDISLVAVPYGHRESRGKTITVERLEVGVARF